MRRTFSACCLSLLLIIVSARAGDAAARPDLPDWALGAVAFRQLGAALDNAGAYASKVVPNSGELAKQVLATAVFKFPVSAGLKRDGAGFIYWLDPVTTGLKDEQLFVLPVADAEAVKKGLSDTFGAPAEADGVQTFTLPQPLPNPDKLLVVKVLKDYVIVAPNALVLKTVEEYLGKTAAETMLGAHPADVSVTVKVAALKRNYENLLAASLDAGAALASQTPEQAAEIRKAAKNFLDRLWELDFVQARLDFEENSAQANLQISVSALDKTASAAHIRGMHGTVSPMYLNLLPGDDTYAVVGISSGGNLANAVRELRRYKVQNPTPQQASVYAVIEKIGELAEGLHSEMKFALGLVSTDPAVVLALRPDELAGAVAQAKSAYEQLAQLIEQELNKDLPAGQPKLICKMEVVEGEAIQTCRLDVPALQQHPNADLEQMVRLSTVRLAPLDHDLLVAFGPAGVAMLESASQRSKEKAGVAAPLMPYTNFLKKDTSFAVYLRPLGLMGNWLSVNNLNRDGAMLKGLDDAPLLFGIDATGNTATARLKLPAATLYSFYILHLRLQRAGINPWEIGQPKQDAPAPPPPGK